MTVWKYSDTLREDEQVYCDECEGFSPFGEWLDTEVGCETCGSHYGVKCPLCGMGTIDTCLGQNVEVRE